MSISLSLHGLHSQKLTLPPAPLGTKPTDFPKTLSSNIPQQLYAGRAVWAYAPETQCWEKAIIACTNLLADRCLFEVVCDRIIRSDHTFREGRGITCHTAFYRTDWFLRDVLSDCPPPAHPRMGARHLLEDLAIRLPLGISGVAPTLGVIESIDSRKKTFTLVESQPIETAARQKGIRRFPSRHSFPFSQRGVEVLSATSCRIGQKCISKNDLITFPGFSGLKAAFRVVGIDTKSQIIAATGCSLLEVGQVAALPFRDVARVQAHTFAHGERKNLFTKKFPALFNGDSNLNVTFIFRGQTLVGHTSIHMAASTLPAFLEVLVWKRDVPNLRGASTVDDRDSLYRFQLKAEEIQAICPLCR